MDKKTLLKNLNDLQSINDYIRNNAENYIENV